MPLTPSLFLEMDLLPALNAFFSGEIVHTEMGSPEEGPALLFTLTWVLSWQPLTTP